MQKKISFIKIGFKISLMDTGDIYTRQYMCPGAVTLGDTLFLYKEIFF